jgi:hypothetical protein
VPHPGPVDQPKIAVTANGKPMLTLNDIVEQAGLSYEAARKLVSRAHIEPVARVGNVYDPALVQDALDNRPGYGAPGVARGPRTPSAQ